MNNTKIINYLMMQTLDATHRALQELDIRKEEPDLVIVEVQLQNIEHYAKMIIQKDGAI